MAVLINMAASVLIGKRIKYSGNETEAGLLGAPCVFLSVTAHSSLRKNPGFLQVSLLAWRLRG